MKRTYRWSELRKILRKYDSRFELDKGRGKGSHRTIRHPDFKKPYTIPCPRGDKFEFDKGRGKGSHRTIRHPDFKKPYTIPCPRGDKSVISKIYLNRIKKRFNLPDDLL